MTPRPSVGIVTLAAEDHVVPRDDRIEEHAASRDCICGPVIQTWVRNGRTGWHVDHREFWELMTS